MLLYDVGDAGYYMVGSLAATVGIKVNDPIFIIGTGRCGTTLLVKILKSHKQLVTYPTEANNLWHPKSYPYSKKTVETPPILEDPEIFSIISTDHWPNGHEQRIQNTFHGFHVLGGSSKGCIVKSAMISFLIPKILSIFSEAKFVHMYRSGPSVVESLTIKEWEKYCNYFDSKSEFRSKCAKYWNDCILEIEKQKVHLSLERKGILLELSYEQLCENPCGALDRLGKFLGVAPSEFAFDTSKISSRNFKAGDYAHDETWIDVLQLMSSGMALKGYDL